VPYVGPGVLSSAVAMDKSVAKELLQAQGLPVARWRTVHRHERGPTTAAQLADELGLPLFVKPANMGSSIGVSRAETLEALDAALDDALRYDDTLVVEELVRGREIEVAVLGNDEPRASVPGEIVPSHEFYDYEDKYVVDGAQLLVPAPLEADETAAVQRLALAAFRALRCEGMARVDFFLDEAGNFIVNEINTIPGFTPISMYPKLWEASGVGYAALIDELVRLALERHARRSRFR
jgi:D-alanine-D-alanine ligase